MQRLYDFVKAYSRTERPFIILSNGHEPAMADTLEDLMIPDGFQFHAIPSPSWYRLQGGA